MSGIDGIMWSDFPHAPETLGLNVSNQEWFQGVSNRWEPYVSGVYKRLSDSQPFVVVVAAPVLRNGEPIGIIAIHYRLEGLANWLHQIHVGEEGYVVVLDPKGIVAVHPRLDLQSRFYDEYANLEPIRNALTGAARNEFYTDPFENEEVVASIAPVMVAGRRWAVVAQQPTEVAYAPIHALRVEITIAAAIVALIAFFAATGLGRVSSKIDALNAVLKDQNLKLAQLALIVQSSNDAILSTDFEGTIASWNPGAERMFGFTADEAVGRSASIYIPARLAGEMKELLARVKAGERIENRDSIRVAKDGRELNVSLSIAPLRSESGSIEGATTIARDVTEQRRAEAALVASNERFSLIAQGTNDGLWDWNLETNELYFSPRWKEMLGYRDDEIKNSFDEWEMRVHPDDHDRALVTIRDYLESRTPIYELEHRMKHKDGSYRWILARGYARRRLNGKPYRMAGSHIDLTERKKAAEDLALKARELARSNSELEQFAYVASHDLREPLRMIGSFGQHLAKRCKGKLDNVAEQYLAQVLGGAERMKNLIDDLLEFSRVGMRGKPFEPVDCNAILNVSLQNLKVALEESGGKVEAGPLPTVLGDAVQLTQLLQNLIGNALKFKGKDAPRVSISAEKIGHDWRFEVKDNGLGIDPMHFKRIFAIFARLHTREEYPGTGIGLSICKRIAERHGGTIWVESEPGKGSSFFFTIAA